MCKGYSSRFCVCVSVTALAATYLVYTVYVQNEVMYSFLGVLKIYCR